MLRCLNLWGGDPPPSLCKAIPRAPREHTHPTCRTPQIPPSRRLGGAFCNPLGPAVFPLLTPLADWLSPPAHTHLSPQLGEEKHLAGSFLGFHLEKQSNGFYGCSSPAQNIKAGFAHWSLQKGRMKTRVHICTFMSCHRRSPFLKKPTFAQLNSGRAAGGGRLDNPKD